MNGEIILVASISSAGGIIAALGGKELIMAIIGRKPKTAVAVENEVKLAQQAATQAASSAAYAAQMQESARQAWAQAHAAEQRIGDAEGRVDAMERKANEVQFKLDIVARYVVWLLDLIGEPGMEIETLRVHVAKHRPPASVHLNGRDRL